MACSRVNFTFTLLLAYDLVCCPILDTIILYRFLVLYAAGRVVDTVTELGVESFYISRLLAGILQTHSIILPPTKQGKNILISIEKGLKL
jgi:hypothetical protein